MHLRSACETFDVIGAIAWSERTRGEQRPSGEAGSNRCPDARDRLAAHERSIAPPAGPWRTHTESHD